jgi:hypothetical protein
MAEWDLFGEFAGAKEEPFTVMNVFAQFKVYADGRMELVKKFTNTHGADYIKPTPKFIPEKTTITNIGDVEL